MNPDIEDILDKVEAQEDVIAQTQMDTTFGLMTEVSAKDLASAMYTLLNLTMEFGSDAYKVLDKVKSKVGGGLEIGRRLTSGITNRGPQRKALFSTTSTMFEPKSMQNSSSSDDTVGGLGEISRKISSCWRLGVAVR